MLNSHEAASFDLQASLVRTESVITRQPNLTLWAGLFVFTVLLFSAVSLPAVEAKEPGLSTDSLLNLLNQDRVKDGLSPLKKNLKLEKAAQAKAQDILQNNYFAHTSPAGVTPWDFIKNAGFAYNFAGENLAINYNSAYELENDFLKSPSNRENLLSPLFSEVGIAVLQGVSLDQPVVVTVQMFGQPVSTASDQELARY